MRLLVLAPLLSLGFALAQPQPLSECRVVAWTSGVNYRPGAVAQRWECSPVGAWAELAELAPVLPALGVFAAYALGLTLGRAIWS